MSIGTAEFNYVRDLVLGRSAIVLEPGKEYLVESRLAPLARDAGFATVDQLVGALRARPQNGLQRRVVEAMTTNETSFFRDVHPFEALAQTVVPALIARRASTRQLTIWCAASSTGQEPYTIAMLLRERLPQLGGWTVRIVATDLSTDVLTRARAGRFSQLEVNRGLPAGYLKKYFEKRDSEWELKAEIRRMVEFRELNLIDPWLSLPSADIVFMRNVLIYFDVAVKRSILGKVRQILRPDGYLFLGGAETTMNLDEAFQRVPVGKATCYTLPGAGGLTVG